MPDSKISDLSSDATVTGTEQVPVNDSGTTKRVTTQQIANLAPAFVGAKAYATSTQNTGASSETAVLFDSEEFDSDGFHSTVTNTSRFTIPSGLGGWYQFDCGGRAPNSTEVSLDFKINGTTYIRAAGGGTHPGNRCHATGIGLLSAGDYVEAIFFTTASITVGNGSGTKQDEMAMTIRFLGT
jgi:hypothetical protein